MSNHVLVVTNAGFGTTPECPTAKFKPNDICTFRKQRVVVAIVVPPHHPAEYALADAFKRPRPLMITEPSKAVSYIIGYLDRDPGQDPTLVRERDLRPTGEKFDGDLYEPGAAQ